MMVRTGLLTWFGISYFSRAEQITSTNTNVAATFDAAEFESLEKKDSLAVDNRNRTRERYFGNKIMLAALTTCLYSILCLNVNFYKLFCMKMFAYFIQVLF